MNKYVICNYNLGGRGKTQSLRNLISELSAFATPDVEPLSEVDMYAKFEIEGIKIAVITQGDPDGYQGQKLQEAAQWGADVIVCAARTSGSTIKNITEESLLDKYDKVWFKGFFDETDLSDDEHEIFNVGTAMGILYEIGFLNNIRCIMNKFQSN